MLHYPALDLAYGPSNNECALNSRHICRGSNFEAPLILSVILGGRSP